MDDFLIAVADVGENVSQEVIDKRVQYIIDIFSRVGIIVSPKLEIKPASFFLFIGKKFNTIDGIILPNDKKIPFIIEQLEKALDSQKVSIKTLDSLRGKLFYHANSFFNRFSGLFNQVISKVRKSLDPLNLPTDKMYKKLYQTKVCLSDEIYSMFYLFFEAINGSFFQPLKKIDLPFFDAFLTVDASTETAGASLIDKDGNFTKSNFFLTPEIDHFEDPSSTVKELLGIQKALLNLVVHSKYLHGVSSHRKVKLLVINDNRINIHNIVEHMPHDKQLQELYITFQKFLETLPIECTFWWIPREDLFTRVADTLSKAFPPLFAKKKLTTFLTKKLFKSFFRKRTKEQKLIFISDPKVIKNYSIHNLHKTELHSKRKGNTQVFILPPFLEVAFFQSFVLTLKLKKKSFILIIPSYRTSVFKSILQSYFPSIICHANKSPKIHFPYSDNVFSWNIFGHFE